MLGKRVTHSNNHRTVALRVLCNMDAPSAWFTIWGNVNSVGGGVSYLWRKDKTDFYPCVKLAMIFVNIVNHA